MYVAKRLSLLLGLYLLVGPICVLYGQVVEGSQEYDVVLRPSIPAYFPGCSNHPEGTEEKAACSVSRMMSFISNTLSYPVEAREQKVEGVAVLSFIVSDSGWVKQVKLLRDLGGGCGLEAKRVLEAMPKWQPAIHKGSRVATSFTIPITFSLREGIFDYVLHVGDLPDEEVFREEVARALATQEVYVTNPKGNEMILTELILKYERGGTVDELVLGATKKAEEKTILKFLKKRPGRLTIEANVVEDLDIRTVRKDYLIIR